MLSIFSTSFCSSYLLLLITLNYSNLFWWTTKHTTELIHWQRNPLYIEYFCLKAGLCFSFQSLFYEIKKLIWIYLDIFTCTNLSQYKFNAQNNLPWQHWFHLMLKHSTWGYCSSLGKRNSSQRCPHFLEESILLSNMVLFQLHAYTSALHSWLCQDNGQ